MGKQQLSTVDVAAEVACLRSRVTGMTLINVFDLNQKVQIPQTTLRITCWRQTYLLKLGTSGEAAEKVFVIIESSCRLHTTQYERQHGNFPSPFNLKLRKHLRNRRLNDIRQLGVDRIVDFTFGQGEKAMHLLLEIYAQGNIVLTDSKYEVMTLLRTHTDAETSYVLRPKHPYPVQHIRMPKPVTEEDMLASVFESGEPKTLKSIVGTLLPFGGACAEHVVLCANLDPTLKLPILKDGVHIEAEKETFKGSDMMQQLMKEIKNLETWFRNCIDRPPPGCILIKGTTDVSCMFVQCAVFIPDQQPPPPERSSDTRTEIYTEFEPFLLHQHRDRQTIEFDTFDAALDAFFSKREEQKIAQAEVSAQSAAEARLMKTRRDLDVRSAKLREEATNEDRQAQLIEYNLTTVDEVLLGVNSLLACGTSWEDVEMLVQNELELGSSVAACIHSLQLHQNAMTLMLSEGDDPDDLFKVTVDLSLSAAANAQMHYEQRKRHALKERRTQEANEAAIKAAEKKIQAELKKKPVVTMHHLRKPHWFEKFYWFITTENYLVISGKDAQQNELIVKRYMKKDDIYVHADLHGASATVIKNYIPGMAVPPISLYQAGAASICRSQAWDSKVMTSAWWVHPEQVSKTAPTGEYLTTGSFMIRGKKNYLTPTTLTYGFGFMFKLDEGSIGRHKGDRVAKIEEPIDKSHHEGHPTRDTQLEGTAEDGMLERSALDIFMEASVDDRSVFLADRSGDEAMAVTSTAISDKTPPCLVAQPKHESGSKAGSKPMTKSEAVDNQQGGSKKGQSKQTGKGKKKGKQDAWDEEDIQLMSELLQSAGPKKSKQQRRQERKQKKAEKRAAIVATHIQTTEEEIKDVISKATETPFAMEAVSDDDSPVEISEDVVLGDAASELDSEEQELETLTVEKHQLDTLTGQPHIDDILLYALPVCAPYESLVHHRYKVKLIPGTLKKGKAGKQCAELLTRGKDVPSRDLSLMKAVTDPEIANVMIGGVKLSMPGMQKIKQQQKKHK